MSARLRNDNFLVYPCDQGWVAVTSDLWHEVLPHLSAKSPWGRVSSAYRTLLYDTIQVVFSSRPSGHECCGVLGIAGCSLATAPLDPEEALVWCKLDGSP